MHPHQLAMAALQRVEFPFIAAAGGEPIAAEAPLQIWAKAWIFATPLVAEQVVGPAAGLLWPALAAQVLIKKGQLPLVNSTTAAGWCASGCPMPHAWCCCTKAMNMSWKTRITPGFLKAN